mmetsp:Transcript_3813/g.11855  ORF Transcript_3813/g.11855 Transcript_3813/m.11855 type:complete len:229 (-) Transcript_3813:261-947(-)
MFAALVLLPLASAFVAPAGHTAAVVTRTAPLKAYVPDGLTAEQYAKLKKKEVEEAKKKNFGAGGARGFKSRSMQSFMLAYERGEAKHLFPVDPAKVRKGEIALKDVPYMQRGGSWDNKDLKGKQGWMNTGFGMKAFNDGKAKTMKKNKYDDVYNKMKPSTNFFGTKVGIDWTGKAEMDQRAKKNGLSVDQQMWRDAGALTPEQARKQRGGAPKIGVKAEPEKKFFGLF